MTTVRERQTFAGTGLLSRYASLVKLPHTLFALPFAGLGAVLAAYHHPLRAADAVLIVVAFTSARFAAMAFNRLADREYDARNPRTRGREIPAGALSPAAVATSVGVAALVFVGSAFALNPLVGALSPVALAVVLVYPYTKRFTLWSHPVLGLCLGMAPVGGYLAIAGGWPDPWEGLVVLALAVMCWVAGFDVIYALQDEAFDRQEGLHSLPARLGQGASLVVARLFHVAAVAGFLLFWFRAPSPLGPLYLLGVGAVALLLVHEHAVIRGSDRGELDEDRVDRAFFRVNVWVSASLFLFTLADLVAGGGA